MLRGYQKSVLKAIADAMERGVERCVVQMATGTGKTQIFSHLPQSGRMLVVAHRHELLEQSREKIERANPGLCVEIEQGERKAGRLADVVVASVQSLYQEKRLARFDPGEFGTIVIDEVHHCAKGRVTYEKVLHHFYAPGTSLTGWTATVRRSDNIGLETFFDEIVYSYGLREAIVDGWLVPLRAFSISTGTDISQVRSTAGDFNEGELAETVNIENRNLIAVKAYQEHANGRSCLVFCVNVEHAYTMRDTFRAAGIHAETVVGTTNEDERDVLVDGFRNGDIRVLCGVGVFSEGFDAPVCDCVLMARPTQSGLVFTQQIGRGTRPVIPLTDDMDRASAIRESAKRDCLILDLVDNAGKHAAKLQTAATLLGLPRSMQMGGDDLVDIANQLDRVKVEHPELDLSDITSLGDARELVRRLEIQAREVALFSNPRLELPELFEMSQLYWLRSTRGYYLDMAGKRLLLIEDMLGHWDIVLERFARGEETKRIRIGRASEIDAARTGAEDYIHTHEREQLGLLRRNAKWRSSNAPVTDKQAILLSKWGIPCEGLTKSRASDIISARLARRS